MRKMKVTPYEVEGDIDYDRLVRILGASKITPAMIRKMKKVPLLMRRGQIYAHRDFDKTLTKKFAIVSGIGPSGELTLGHLATFRFVKQLQDIYGCYVFVPFSDDEKFFYKDIDFKTIQKYTLDNALDLVALGFDPKKTEFAMDLSSLNQDIYNLAVKCAKRMTFSMIKDALGFTPSNNVGSIFYPAMQAAHILYPTAKYKLPVTVVVAIDQDVMVRLARDVAQKIGLEKPGDLLGKFLPSLQGDAKMSSSKPETAIYVNDSPAVVKKKIQRAFSGGKETLAEHRKYGGNPDIDASFQYLKLFFIEDDKELAQIEKAYRSGEMTTGELKKIAIKYINEFLAEHRKKKAIAKKTNMLKRFIRI